MFAINVLSCLNKSYSTKVRAVVSSLKNVRRYVLEAKHPSSYSVKSQTKKDLVLFSLEDRKRFIWINIGSAVQCASWTYVGGFLLQSVNDPNISLKARTFWGELLQNRKYSSFLSYLTIILGWSIFATTIFYSLRSIKTIILHKGGQTITIVTYGIPGLNTFLIPVNHVSAMQHRTKAKKFISLKIKKSYFYYLIDVSGKFSNPQLFDFTVGIKRAF